MSFWREKQKNGPCFGSVKRIERVDHSAGVSSLVRGCLCQYRFGNKKLEADQYFGSSNEDLEAYLSYTQMDSVSVLITSGRVAAISLYTVADEAKFDSPPLVALV